MHSTMPRHPRRKGQRPPGVFRDDRGSFTVEFAIGAPILIGILLLLLQMSFWGMGYLSAHAAADHALQTSRVVGGTAAAGHDDAAALLNQLSGPFIDNPSVTVTRDADTTTVTIHGTAHGLPIPINVTVQAPTERYTR